MTPFTIFGKRKDKEDNVSILKREDTIKPPETMDGPQGRGPRLVVVGDGKTFSQELISYSIEMARRLGSCIVALNAAPIGEDLPVKSIERHRLMEEFEKECRDAASPFIKKGKEGGIEVEHVVKFLPREAALQEIKEQYPDMEFVISDSEKDYVPSKGEKHRGICVYSIV